MNEKIYKRNTRIMQVVFLVAYSILGILFFGCEIGTNASAEVEVSVKASIYYCNECGYEWVGSTMTTVLCPACESMRIEIVGEAE